MGSFPFALVAVLVAVATLRGAEANHEHPHALVSCGDYGALCPVDEALIFRELYGMLLVRTACCLGLPTRSIGGVVLPRPAHAHCTVSSAKELAPFDDSLMCSPSYSEHLLRTGAVSESFTDTTRCALYQLPDVYCPHLIRKGLELGRHGHHTRRTLT